MSNKIPKTCLTDGSPITPDHRELKDNGQQQGYVVLCPEERAKGFVRPVRQSYVHVGKKPMFPLRDLTEEEKARHNLSPRVELHYVKYEDYSEDLAPLCGKFWTADELSSMSRACGGTTTMGQALAETYARDPHFYSGTFCATCQKHFPVGADGEFVWAGTNEKVGT